MREERFAPAARNSTENSASGSRRFRELAQDRTVENAKSNSTDSIPNDRAEYRPCRRKTQKETTEGTKTRAPGNSEKSGRLVEIRPFRRPSWSKNEPSA
jgi:hypothetical protein